MSLADWKDRAARNRPLEPATANPAKVAKDDAKTSVAVDLDAGWQRRVAVAAWHAYWLDLWRRRAGQPISPSQLAAAADFIVRWWCQWTGDRQCSKDFMKHLSPADLVDREILTTAWLALYCWTLWHRDARDTELPPVTPDVSVKVAPPPNRRPSVSRGPAPLDSSDLPVHAPGLMASGSE
jgi:hypothetical protein